MLFSTNWSICGTWGFHYSIITVKDFKSKCYEPCNQVIGVGSTWTHLLFSVSPRVGVSCLAVPYYCQIALCHLTREQLFSVKQHVVHFFIFWTTKTGKKTQSEAHQWWHPGETLRQASCLDGTEMMASVSRLLMWGSWIICKHVCCCQVRIPEK